MGKDCSNLVVLPVIILKYRQTPSAISILYPPLFMTNRIPHLLAQLVSLCSSLNNPQISVWRDGLFWTMAPSSPLPLPVKPLSQIITHWLSWKSNHILIILLSLCRTNHSAKYNHALFFSLFLSALLLFNTEIQPTVLQISYILSCNL